MRDIAENDLRQPEFEAVDGEEAVMRLSDADAEYAMSLRGPLFADFMRRVGQ